MKVYVVYDSNYGNTKIAAEEIAAVFGTKAEHVDNFKLNDLQSGDVLIAGSPVNAWRPTEKMRFFLKKIHSGQLKGVRVAAFDTRFKSLFSGNACKKINRALLRAGAIQAALPVGFIVNGMEGPLHAGELDRAKKWAQEIKSREVQQVSRRVEEPEYERL